LSQSICGRETCVSPEQQTKTITRKQKDRELMQQKSTHSEKLLEPPVTRSNYASHDGQTKGLLKVTQEAVEAYEKRTGFYGIGRIMVEDGHWIIVTKEERVRSRAKEHTNQSMMSRQGGSA
jgi:hypothetical protein